MRIHVHIAILCAFVAIGVVSALFVDHQHLSMLASIAALLSVMYAVSVYFLNTVDEQMRISKNLYGELQDTLDTLKWRDDKSLEPGMEIVVTVDGKRHRHTFTNKYLNHDVYDSLINSGKINFLIYELQQQVQNIFKMIKHHNEYLRYTKYHHTIDPTDLLPYYKIIDAYEQSLLKQVPDMLKKLKRKFPSISD